MTSPPSENGAPRSRWWAAVGVLVLATAAGVLEALQILLPGGRIHGVDGFVDALVHAVPSWWILALLIPAGWWLGSRYPLVSGRWRRRALLHVLASLAFPAVVFGLVALFYAVLDGRVTLSRLWTIGIGLAQIYYVYYVFFYWIIVGAAQGLHYYRAAKEHEISELRLRSDLSQARLSALRAQLNPHFLFNSLNTIVGMALERGHEEVADAVTELSELLRETLREGEVRLVPLGREIAFTRRYLHLQEHRFGDRLAYEFDVPDELEEALVPAMILQPLVENAVLHGIVPGPARGTVAVRARRRGDRLRLDVEDTGPGFPEEAEAGGRNGIGLKNTRERIVQLFGSECDIELGRGRGGGALVTVSIPYLLEPRPMEAAADALA